MSDEHSFATLLSLKRIARAMGDRVPVRAMALLTEDLAKALLDDGKLVEGALAGQQAMIMESMGGLFEAIIRDLAPEFTSPAPVGFDTAWAAERYRAMSWEELE